MKYFFFIAISVLMLSCNDSETALKGPENLQFRLDKAVLVSRLKDIDSADVNVQYIKKTQYFFKKSSFNSLRLSLYIEPKHTIDDAFVDKSVKLSKLTLERELLNYFSYDGLILDFYQNGEKIRTYEENFKE